MMQKLNIPEGGPIYQGNVLARQHSVTFEPLYLDVLACLKQFSERDQLALIVAIHKTGLVPQSYEPGFRLVTHYTERLDKHHAVFFDPEARPEHLLHLGPHIVPRFLYYVSRRALRRVSRSLLSPIRRAWKHVAYRVNARFFQPSADA